MAELATIARPYADALFKAVTAGAGVDLGSTAAWVDELAAIAANPSVDTIMALGASTAGEPSLAAVKASGAKINVATFDLSDAGGGGSGGPWDLGSVADAVDGIFDFGSV